MLQYNYIVLILTKIVTTDLRPLIELISALIKAKFSSLLQRKVTIKNPCSQKKI